ncbi:hypothetical protein LINPERHAP1_LOCUS14406 [Linum perenne]
MLLALVLTYLIHAADI